MEIKNKKYIVVVLTIITSLLMFDKNNITKKYLDDENYDSQKIKESSVRFSPDYKTMDVDIELSDSLSSYMLLNNRYVDSIAVEEIVVMLNEYNKETQPKIIDVSEDHNRYFDSIQTLVVVDLTLSQEQINAQKEAVAILFRSTFNENLHIKFAGNGGITKLMPVSEYVLEHLFVPQSDENYLFRDIVEQYDHVRYDTLHHYGVSSWLDVANNNKLLFVFSDEQTYRNGYPIDYYNYTNQQRLYKMGLEVEADKDKRVPFYYVSFNTTDPRDRGSIHAATKLRIENFCKATGGQYFDKFNYLDIFENIARLQNIKNVKYKISLENPVNKSYAGALTDLQISAYDHDSLVFKEHLTYSLGHFYDPIYIGYKPTTRVKVMGVIYVLLLLAGIYLALQIIYPYAVYNLVFKRKYVKRHLGEMTIQGENIVEGECYYCKDKFVKDDEIVVKCRHTMHKDCWEENNYHCPEYGENCDEGSFYYNKQNLFDPLNAPYVMWWIMWSVIAALIIWLTYFVIKDINMPIIDKLFVDTLAMIDQSEVLNTTLSGNISSGRYLYKYGFNICFWIPLILGLKSSWGSSIKHKLPLRLLIAVVSGLCGGAFFFIYAIVTTPIFAHNNAPLVILTLWVLNSLVIGFMTMYATPISIRKTFIRLLVATFIAIISLYICSFQATNQLSSFYIQLIFNTIYCLGFAISFAYLQPESKRYFLRVDGCRKPLDIAIFKWFNSQNSRVQNNEIFIGRSIDCDIHLDWDLSPKISPIHATIKREKGKLHLYTNDKMSVNGKDVDEGKKFRLYNKTYFEIGKSKFRYIEKDSL